MSMVSPFYGTHYRTPVLQCFRRHDGHLAGKKLPQLTPKYSLWDHVQPEVALKQTG